MDKTNTTREEAMGTFFEIIEAIAGVENITFPYIVKDRENDFKKNEALFLQEVQLNFDKFKEICSTINIEPTFELYLSIRHTVAPFKAKSEETINQIAESLGGFRSVIPEEVKKLHREAIHKMNINRDNLIMGRHSLVRMDYETQYFQPEHCTLSGDKVVLQEWEAERIKKENFTTSIDSAAELNIYRQLQAFQSAYNNFVRILRNCGYPQHQIDIGHTHILNFFNEQEDNSELKMNSTGVKWLLSLKK